MALPAATPLFFGPTDRARAGWLHRAERASSLGVVVCNPFGYEAICAHRSLRHLAESMARAGVPALRFDYDGTGDSVGDDRDPDRVVAWIASVHDACAALRAHGGVDRVVLVGVRLGALIAALAAADVGAVGLVAIAPVISGRAYLRELGMLQGALGLGGPPTTAATHDAGETEALGFAISAQTRAAILPLDLAKDEVAPSGAASFEVLVLDRADLPGAERWVAHLERRGVKVSSQRLPGYVEMMLDPHKVVLPERILRSAVDWVSALQKCEASRDENRSSPASPVEEPRAETQFGGVFERAVFVDEARRVFAILSGTTTEPSGRAIVLLNAGAVHHVGPNRLHVRLARRWAAHGDHVLRMDIAGIGDSPPRPGERENVIYHRAAVEDVRAAIGMLRREFGTRDVRIVGLCAGAYHALKAASADPGVTGFIAINPLTFAQPPEGQVEFSEARVSAEAVRYQRSALDREKWKKLLRGDARLRVLAQVLARHATARLKTRARDLSRRLLPWHEDVGRELERLAMRNVAQTFIFTNGDPGERLLREQAGPAVLGLCARGGLQIDRIDGPDHTFTPVWSHLPLEEMLTTALRRRAGER